MGKINLKFWSDNRFGQKEIKNVNLVNIWKNLQFDLIQQKHKWKGNEKIVNLTQKQKVSRILLDKINWKWYTLVDIGMFSEENWI